MKFSGIPAGKLQVTPVPNLLFSEMLPLMDDAAQIKVSLHIYYLLTKKKGSPRYVTYDELLADDTLMGSLEYKKQTLKRGLDKAVNVGILLQADAEGVAWYFFNTPESRTVLEKIASGELKLKTDIRLLQEQADAPPNIFKHYEQEIGTLTPIIAEELKEAEQDYPPEIILDAFRIAAENNVRSWKYVNTILLNWAREHKHEKTRRPPTGKRRPVVTGKLAELAKSK